MMCPSQIFLNDFCSCGVWGTFSSEPANMGIDPRMGWPQIVLREWVWSAWHTSLLFCRILMYQKVCKSIMTCPGQIFLSDFGSGVWGTFSSEPANMGIDPKMGWPQIVLREWVWSAWHTSLLFSRVLRYRRVCKSIMTCPGQIFLNDFGSGVWGTFSEGTSKYGNRPKNGLTTNRTAWVSLNAQHNARHYCFLGPWCIKSCANQ